MEVAARADLDLDLVKETADCVARLLTATMESSVVLVLLTMISREAVDVDEVVDDDGGCR